MQTHKLFVRTTAVGNQLCRVELVLYGAEAVVENGGIINKLGSYQVSKRAVAAAQVGCLMRAICAPDIACFVLLLTYQCLPACELV